MARGGLLNVAFLYNLSLSTLFCILDGGVGIA